MGKVLHASNSGYFPYCLNTQNVSSYPYVAQINLDLAMAIFWRAKRIRWFGNITWPSVGWDNLPWHLEISSSATMEEGLVCWPKWIVSSVENLNDGGGNPINVGSDSLWNSTEFYYEEGSSQSNLVNLDLTISAFFVSGAILGFTLGAFSFNTVYQYYSMPFANAGTLILAGEFPYTGNQAPIFDSSPPNDYTTTLNHTIEYWSYGETYNISTGLPL